MNDKPFHLELLHHEIQKRKLSNPRYSLRAFSRHLGMGPSTLSRILSNNQDLSLSASKKIIKKLKFNSDDRRLFISSIAEEKKQRTLSSLSRSIHSEDEEYLVSFEEMLRSSRDLLIIMDRSGRCAHANETAAKYFALPRHQIIGKTMVMAGFPVDLALKIACEIEKVWSTKTLLVVEERYSSQTSAQIYEIVLLPILNEEEEVLGVTCHWRDITDTIQVEDYLRVLVESGQILSRTTNYHEALEEVARLVNRKVADSCLIRLIKEKKNIHAGDENLVNEVFRLFSLDPESGDNFCRILDADEPKVIKHLGEANYNIFRSSKIALGSFLCLPLKSRDQNFGSIILMRKFDREAFCSRDLELIQDLGFRAAEAIDYSILFERCHD